MKTRGTELPIDEQLQREQALAIKSLVITNTRLQKIEDNVRAKIKSLAEYNSDMNDKQHLTVILQSEFEKVLKV
jgi:predicted transcriptional regulator